MEDSTRKFTALDSKTEMREILSSVYNPLMVKGYNPINQIVGYILSEDPTYITNYNNARTLICRIDRDELMQELVRNYLDKCALCVTKSQGSREFRLPQLLVCSLLILFHSAKLFRSAVSLAFLLIPVQTAL